MTVPCSMLVVLFIDGDSKETQAHGLDLTTRFRDC
jgi:hypothetical protein